MQKNYSEQEPTLEQVNAAKGWLLLEFGAPWCGHCQGAQTAIENALSQNPVPNLEHTKVYDGKGKALGRAFRVKLWPTLILLHHGEEVSRVVRPTETKQVLQLFSES